MMEVFGLRSLNRLKTSINSALNGGIGHCEGICPSGSWNVEGHQGICCNPCNGCVCDGWPHATQDSKGVWHPNPQTHICTHKCHCNSGHEVCTYSYSASCNFSTVDIKFHIPGHGEYVIPLWNFDTCHCKNGSGRSGHKNGQNDNLSPGPLYDSITEGTWAPYTRDDCPENFFTGPQGDKFTDYGGWRNGYLFLGWDPDGIEKRHHWGPSNCDLTFHGHWLLLPIHKQEAGVWKRKLVPHIFEAKWKEIGNRFKGDIGHTGPDPGIPTPGYTGHVTGPSGTEKVAHRPTVKCYELQIKGKDI